MKANSRTYWMSLMMLSVACTACNQFSNLFRLKDHTSHAARSSNTDASKSKPQWAYDQPEYVRPAEELTPQPKVRTHEPLHYFTNQKIVQIRRPADVKSHEVPRLAIWWSDNNGFHWHKAGYFGRGQSHFPLEVEQDGDYGIRFVGPGQKAAVHTPAYPQRVYHVDTILPQVEVAIEPEQTWYHVGESISVSWKAKDFHLIESPVRIVMLKDFSAEQNDLIELQRELSDEGSITYRIPAEALGHVISFRAEAEDRAGNMGLAYTFALQIVNPNQDPTQPAARDIDRSDTVSANPFPNDQIAQDQGVMETGKQVPTVAAKENDGQPSESVAPEDIASLAMISQSPLLVDSPLEVADPFTDNVLAGTRELLTLAPEEEGVTITEREIVAETANEPPRMMEKAAANSPMELESSPPIPYATTLARLPAVQDARMPEAPCADAPSNSDVPWSPEGALTELDKETKVVANEVAQAPLDPNDQNSSISNSEPPGDDVTHPVISQTDQATPEPAQSPSATTALPLFDLNDQQDGVVEESIDPLAAMAADKSSVGSESPAPHGVSVTENPDLAEAAQIQNTRTPNRVDVTHGNGLLIPLPATLQTEASPSQWITAHPWRILQSIRRPWVSLIWVLPKPRTNFSWTPMYLGRFLADNPVLRAVADPAASARAVAGITEATLESEVDPVP